MEILLEGYVLVWEGFGFKIDVIVWKLKSRTMGPPAERRL